MDEIKGTLHCPNCGSSAEPDSASCPYCRSPLATVSCPKCFGSLFLGMKHCPWCGSEASRQVVKEQKGGSCPRCVRALTMVEVGTSTFQECQQCGGLWIGKETFEKICANKEEQEAVLSTDLPASFMAQDKPPASRVYIPCPVCGNLMNRMNFAGCSGVVIDWCKAHGTWFDPKELRQIVQFIQGGGMKKSREREKENLKAELQRLKVQQMELRLQENRLGSSSTEARGWKEQPDSLLDFLSGLWGTLTKAD